MAIKRKFPARTATVHCSGGCRAKRDENGGLLCAYGCVACGACVEACPVGAISPNRTINASRCIARRTIEAEPDNEGELHGWIFGCDTCQQVCPHNRHAPVSPHTCFAPTPGLAEMTANDWLQLTDEEFKHRFRDTPLLRCGLQRIQRRIHELQDITYPAHSIPSK